MAHSVPKVAPRSRQEIEAIAFSLVEAFQPDAVKMLKGFDVEKFFEFKLKEQTGMEPVYRPLGEGLDGFTNIRRMECVVCARLADYGEDDAQRRKLRATQAHEIGHCHLHVEEMLKTRAVQEFRHDKRHARQDLYRQEEIKVFTNPEWQAWRFAGALLMPERCVRHAVDRGWTVQMMSRAFDVNPAFVKVRLHSLQIPKRVRER